MDMDMKVSEMIVNLQEFMKEHGDLDCWYVKDDEGNGYGEVYYAPTLYYTNESNDHEMYDSLERAEEWDVDIDELTPICIVN